MHLQAQALLASLHILYETICEFDDKRRSFYVKTPKPRTTNYKNVITAAHHIQEFAAQFHISLPALQAWTASYLAQHRSELFYTFMVKKGAEYLHLRIHKYDRRGEKYLPDNYAEMCVATLAPLSAPTYDCSFQNAQKIVEDLLVHSKPANPHTYPITLPYCKDETILAIHKDKECDDGDYWNGCGLCTGMEYEWSNSLKNAAKNSGNIFLDKAACTAFLNDIHKHAQIQGWEPHKIYPYNELDRGKFMSEKLAAANKIIEPGKTAVHCMEKLLDNFHHTFYNFNEIYKKCDEYEYFLFVHTLIDFAPELFEAYCQVAQEIVGLF